MSSSVAPLCELLFELGGLGSKLVVPELLHLFFELVDRLDLRPEPAHRAVVRGAEDLFHRPGEHRFRRLLRAKMEVLSLKRRKLVPAAVSRKV